ncbi:hypothetical protein EZS27_035410 [termite gut metagenome]|uniref:Uncharacterized protein n=1 Tax=termite gut metagenome TaxID=433724 RepID=A0A5J4PZ75_9ZZZZ
MGDIDKSDYKEFNDFIHAIDTEIEQAQIKLVCAANVQMFLTSPLGHPKRISKNIRQKVWR